MEKKKETKMTTPAQGVTFTTDPMTALQIGEVAHVTGYNPMTLRRLDSAKKIPASHRSHSGTRCWYAKEVNAISEYKARMENKRQKRMATLYKKVKR